MDDFTTTLIPNCKPGDPVFIGGLLGYGNEPSDLMGRIVAIRKDDCREMERFIFRRFTQDDFEHGRTFPTGEYRTSWLIVPWSGGYPRFAADEGVGR